MLEIGGLTKRFGDRVALDDLTMSVPPGQVVGLLGPNGSGKTTAMRIIFGVIDADRGEVRYSGGPVVPEVRRRFGYMPRSAACTRTCGSATSSSTSPVWPAWGASAPAGAPTGRRPGPGAVARQPAAGAARGGARPRA